MGKEIITDLYSLYDVSHKRGNIDTNIIAICYAKSIVEMNDLINTLQTKLPKYITDKYKYECANIGKVMIYEDIPFGVLDCSCCNDKVYDIIMKKVKKSKKRNKEVMLI